MTRCRNRLALSVISYKFKDEVSTKVNTIISVKCCLRSHFFDMLSFHWDIESGSGKNELGIHTAKLLFKEDLKVVSASQVTQQFEKAEGPALNTHFGRSINPADKDSGSVTFVPFLL